MCTRGYIKSRTPCRQSSGRFRLREKRTSAADVKRIRNIISDSNYQMAQECQVIVSYPQMHIEGTEVVLGEPLIMLPDCRLINMEQLKDIELGRKK